MHKIVSENVNKTLISTFSLKDPFESLIHPKNLFLEWYVCRQASDLNN